MPKLGKEAAMKAIKPACLTGLMIVLTSAAICFADANAVTLKDAFAKDFLIGAAISDDAVSGKDSNAAAIAEKQLGSITSENMMKWQYIHPRPNEYSFAPADRFVEFGMKNKQFIVGHTFVWHYQTPGWVFAGSDGNKPSRDVMLSRMKEHITTVVGRYKGKVGGWDVVNEAIDDKGGLKKTPWLTFIGEDYIAKAFEYAHEADPNAELYYNDFLLDSPVKRDTCVRLVKDLQARGLRIDGVGIQGHWGLSFPAPKDIEAFIDAMQTLGVKAMVTEMDIDVLPSATNYQGADLSVKVELQKQLNPYADGLPDSVQQKLANRYASLFAVFVKHKNTVSRVTIWGISDKTSWLNNWPVNGRANYPLLFDRNYQPKPAFFAVIKTAKDPNN
jgi:endo-1,4-beta-xylanase